MSIGTNILLYRKKQPNCDEKIYLLESLELAVENFGINSRQLSPLMPFECLDFLTYHLNAQIFFKYTHLNFENSREEQKFWDDLTTLNLSQLHIIEWDWCELSNNKGIKLSLCQLYYVPLLCWIPNSRITTKIHSLSGFMCLFALGHLQFNLSRCSMHFRNSPTTKFDIFSGEWHVFTDSYCMIVN